MVPEECHTTGNKNMYVFQAFNCYYLKERDGEYKTKFVKYLAGGGI
jgi:hypothetical protein